MNENLTKFQGSIVDLHKAYLEFDKLSERVNMSGTIGNISKLDFAALVNNSKDYCSRMINWAKNVSNEEMYYASVEYQNSLESSMMLLQELHSKFVNTNNFGSLIDFVKTNVETCGNSLKDAFMDVYYVDIENVVTDLSAKILLIETEYNAGNLSIEKASKHIQKIKNTYSAYDISKTGKKEFDDEIDFLDYAIKESEKLYNLNSQTIIEDKCSVDEFLNENTDKEIENIANETQNLTICLNQLNVEISNKLGNKGIDLDWLFNKVNTINELFQDPSITYDEIHPHIVMLNKGIDQLKEELVNISISYEDHGEMIVNAYYLATNLGQKALNTSKEIVKNETTKRVNNISTQLDSLIELSRVSETENLNAINNLLIAQSKRCLEVNPEMQTQINENLGKSKVINQNFGYSL